MGRPVTFSTIREAVRQRYDLPAFTTETHINLATVNAMINASIQEYFGILQEVEAEEWYTYNDSITTVANQSFVSVASGLTARFLDIRALHWVRATDDVVELKRAGRDGWTKRSYSARSWDYAPTYELMRDLIYFFPVPAAAYSLRLFYVGAPADLIADGDTFDGGPGWEEFVVLSVCAKIAAKEESPSDYVTLRDMQAETIRKQCTRQKADPTTIRRSFNVSSESTREEWDRLTGGG